ncbi:MAG: DUF2293 domain-containing protein [Gemmataceae bacterium]
MKVATVSPGPTPTTVRAADGSIWPVPPGWILLPPGDAALTRRVKAAGDHWVVQEKKGRRLFSRGVWAPATTIAQIEQTLVGERATPQFARRQEADARRREQVQAEYVVAFVETIEAFLAFHPRYAELSRQLAERVAAHATPVGSGTVARTKRIPIERRAEAAVLAWMRHQTTPYDNLAIPRVKGHRRDVRRRLAHDSRRLLDRYRAGLPADPTCPLHRAVMQTDTSHPEAS